VNPVAGSNKIRLETLLKELEEFAKTLSNPNEIYITKGPMDAVVKIKADAETADMLYVYACGGDGTLNECANGAAERGNTAITHYPCGTGNDFLKTFGKDNVSKFRDLNSLVDGTIRPLDIIDCNGRYGIDISSVGIDARVAADVHKYSSMPLIGGKTGYIVALVANVIKGVTQKFRITVDDKVIDKKITLACACNGRFYGGGFNPVPDAVPDDGVLDILIVEPVSRLKVAQVVGRYKQGRFKEFPELITYIRGTQMDIECDREFVVNIDGEAIYAGKMSFKLIPKGVNFIFPKDFDYDKAVSV